MSNSSLVSYTKISPNRTSPRNKPVDYITPHCVVGQCSVETLGNIFAPTSRQASSNYGIGTDGRIGMYCEEKDRSWCSSSGANDNRAITIECASDTTAPYAMNSKVYAALIDLCVDICKRYGKTKLLWFGDKAKTLAYKPKADEMIITVHRWYANKSCPGDWLYNRLGELATAVTQRLGGTGGSRVILLRPQSPLRRLETPCIGCVSRGLTPRARRGRSNRWTMPERPQTRIPATRCSTATVRWCTPPAAQPPASSPISSR